MGSCGQATELPLSPPHSDGEIDPSAGNSNSPAVSSATQGGNAGSTLTQQPFGETEEQVRHKGTTGIQEKEIRTLGDVDFLDLNALAIDHPAGMLEQKHTVEDQSPAKDVYVKQAVEPRKSSENPISAVSPSSVLNSATALLPLLPNIPFLSSLSSSNKSPSLQEERPGTTSSASFTGPDAKNERQTRDQTGRESENQLAKSTAPAQHSGPPNPMAAQLDASSPHSFRDDTISRYSKEYNIQNPGHPINSDETLPKIQSGQGEGPEIRYGKDIVLDMAGYHSDSRMTELEDMRTDVGLEQGTMSIQDQRSKFERQGEDSHSIPHSRAIKGALLEIFARDLLTSVHQPTTSLLSLSRPGMQTRSTDTMIPQIISPAAEAESGSRLGFDSSKSKFPQEIASSSLTTESIVIPKSTSSFRQESDRGQSEPRQFNSKETDPSYISVPSPSHSRAFLPPGLLSLSSGNRDIFSSPPGAPSIVNSRAAMDDAWDWGRMPSPLLGGLERVSKKSLEMERSLSGPRGKTDGFYDAGIGNGVVPPAGEDLATLVPREGVRGPWPGTLKNLEENPFMFVLDMGDGRSHSFEIALCGEDDFAQDGEASVSSSVKSYGI